ncbi:MAG: DUF3365 domain-containing protein [Vicinamibacterales bacterium]|nr:DUF3365 domain-containing protein [Vicinamibacterales bacterium]
MTTSRQVRLVATVAFALAAAPGAWSQDGTLSTQTPQPAFAAEVAKAEQAMNALQQALLTELSAAMKQGGPPAAITVCHDQAVAIADKVAREQGIALGRTSHRLRNPANAPRPWAKAAVEQSAGAKAASAQRLVVDLGERVGVLRPIGTADMCLRCHGAPDAVRQQIGSSLAASYPQDQATGFAAGDLRGWMWAEVPKAKSAREFTVICPESPANSR